MLVCYSFLYLRRFFYHRFMLRKMTSSMDRRVTSRDPKTLKSMGCRFSVAVSLFIDSHQYDRGQAQGSPLGVPKGINLEARYTCAHQKIKFHRWREFAWSLFPQFDQLLCNCRNFVSWSKHRWVCLFFCPTLGKKTCSLKCYMISAWRGLCKPSEIP